MTANIPLSLSECLAPKEVGALLDISQSEHRPVEDLVVFAIRDFLATHRKPVNPQPEGAGGDAALAA